VIKVGVLAVQGAVSEHLEHLRKCDVEPVAVKNNYLLDAVSGLIIPGGESTTIGKLISEFGLADAIKERTRHGSLALFGTCAGMVLLSGDLVDGTNRQPLLNLMEITVQRNAFGRQRESFETNLDFMGFEKPLTAVFIRAPLIIKKEPAVTVLATLPEGIVAARQDKMLVTSFHPELTSDLRVHQYFIKICREVS
jgi:pyridoxal 5'-phosphate synthase pdxT subunit